VRNWFVGLFTGIVRWLELLAYGIYAFDLTGSPLMVAVLALARFVPLALLSLPFGAAADQISPRKLLVAALAGVALVNGAMLAVQLSGAMSYSMLIVATLASGTFWAADMPLRRKMIGEIAGPDRLARAMSYDYATSNGTRMLGPLMGGVLYQTIGMTGVFAVGLVLYIAAFAIALGIAPTGGPRTGRFRPRYAIVGAVRAAGRAVRDNDVLSILAVTVIFNIWGFPMISMIPVIGDEVLGLSPSLIGYVASVEGLASLFGVLLVAVIARPAWYRRIYVGGLVFHLIAVAFIGLAPGLWALCAGLAVAGVATAGFAVMQATLVYMVAPRGMRGRYLGLMSICIGAGLIGFANVGWMAELFGAQRALQIIAVEGAVALVILLVNWRALHVEAGFSRPATPGRCR